MVIRQLYRLLFSFILGISVFSAAIAQDNNQSPTATNTIVPNTTAPNTIPTIHVGGYQFSPYVNLQQDGRYTGLTLDIINALNQIQQEVFFEFTVTSVEHRYKAYALGRFDMMIFENPAWGWQKIADQFIPLHMIDGEVFIALKAKAHNQNYFKNLTNKSVAFVKGYHYQFAHFETDADKLAKQFRPLFVSNNRASIESILRERADIAPVTHSYLQYYLKVNPQDRHLLLISDKWDQEYDNGILLSLRSSLDAKKLSHWVHLLIDNGKLAELAAQYGIKSSQ
ncbi:substrate-binding periplasmic protein [Shewanella baltica]|uniref:substrate-binding periplasmic protein n=1 Tax=Shewanella baltica TaxID=62322 RepID=UPI003D7BFAC8